MGSVKKLTRISGTVWLHKCASVSATELQLANRTY